MSSGPQNFLNRVTKELNKMDLPKFEIINPHPHQLYKLENSNTIKIGRLDGVIYYKTTSINLYNLFYQRRDRKVAFLKSIPNFFSIILNIPLNYYLNRHSRKVLNNSDAIIFQSELSKKMHQKFVGKVDKESQIILNGIPRDIFYPQEDTIPLEGSPKLVITASFRLHKRLQDAIKIVNDMKNDYPNIKLHVVGDMDNLTQEHIDTLDLSNTIFHGRIESESLPKIYSSCDIGLAMCIFDSCPNSVLEMMSSGLPVITNSQSGASELLEDSIFIVKDDFDVEFMELQTADKIPKVNIKDWIEKIEIILLDKPKYQDMVLERVIDELDIKIVAKKYAEFIMKVHNAKN